MQPYLGRAGLVFYYSVQIIFFFRAHWLSKQNASRECARCPSRDILCDVTGATVACREPGTSAGRLLIFSWATPTMKWFWSTLMAWRLIGSTCETAHHFPGVLERVTRAYVGSGSSKGSLAGGNVVRGRTPMASKKLQLIQLTDGPSNSCLN